ncbi:MAG: NUDIX hydrolase [Candidatus Pacebacteria bacterium]|nr:NUDIX hydrolase [Candidatus Paceibacterota bacterium]
MTTEKSNNKKEYSIIPIETKTLKIFLDLRKQSLPKNVQIEQGYFDGPLIHAKSISFLGPEIMIVGQKSSYKKFIETKKVPRITRMVSIGDYCNPISVGVVLVTSDEKIPFALRSETYLNNSLFSFPAEGYLDPIKDLEDKENRIISFVNAAKREIKEELNIEPENLTSFQVGGIVFDEIEQPYIALFVACKLNSSEVKALFEKSKKEEFKEIGFVENTKEALEKFLKEYQVTPHNQGKIELYKKYKGW